MGVAVSGWRLAQAVARTGQLGVVSGTGIDTVLVRRLQDGDPGGHVLRALGHFPLQSVAATVIERFHEPHGRAPGRPYRLLPRPRHGEPAHRAVWSVVAAFVEVFLAKQGHDEPIGINLLTKVQIPTLPTLYGAMLAGVDVVIMGAGIPREIPHALDQLSQHRPATLRMDVTGSESRTEARIEFDPSRYFDPLPAPLSRPRFLPIVSSHVLAATLARKSTGRVDGFVVEGPTAGGHNAPPRGALRIDTDGQPIYGERDLVDLAQIAELGLPYWLAGGQGHPGALPAARAAGAAGIQVGTLFAFCDESGFSKALKQQVLEHVLAGDARVRTDPRASPTGYPFKVVEWLDAVSRAHVTRPRHCDLGYLREAYALADGSIGYRCPGEPVDSWVRKGGSIEATVGRRCLCNALFAAADLGQLRPDGTTEPPIITSGDDLRTLGEFLRGRTHYSAADVVSYLLGND
ncbi:MAG: nitronate monooxygenase [Planctomycetes bacterium]|nr:nitronate monooxygenase [Planctomycetota bacterium]MCC7170117.1 nitronate monooxygenase [Planctomycetota bacterium]